MEIKIEKDIKPPTPYGKRGKLQRAITTMKVGESFLYERYKRSSITGTISTLKPQQPNKKFTTQYWAENLIRVWRTK